MMPPAFSSLRQAGGYALLLFLILLSPLLVGKSLLSSREQLYLSTGSQETRFAYLHQQIFEEKDDIDIAFLGSSRMGCAIDPSYVENQLTEKLGRPAVVRKLNWSWNGFDALYFVAQDLLQHRKVRMMVLCDLSPESGNTAQQLTSCWFRLDDNAEALAGLPFISKISFYASSIVGIPRNLVNLLRHNSSPAPVSPASQWNYSPFDYTPQTATSPTDVKIYSDANKTYFAFSSEPLPAMQMAFVRKIGALARQYHVQLVFLHIPVPSEEKDSVVNESTFWPDAFGTNVPMVGIPPALLFEGLSENDVHNLFFDHVHFNQNGQKYFMRIMTPSILQVYEEQIKP